MLLYVYLNILPQKYSLLNQKKGYMNPALYSELKLPLNLENFLKKK